MDPLVFLKKTTLVIPRRRGDSNFSSFPPIKMGSQAPGRIRSNPETGVSSCRPIEHVCFRGVPQSGIFDTILFVDLFEICCWLNGRFFFENERFVVFVRDPARFVFANRWLVGVVCETVRGHFFQKGPMCSV